MSRRHVHEADVVRVLTFAAVIGVHTVSQTNSNDSVAANGVVMLLHFTREAFFVLTGFVLAHQYYARPYRLTRFWTRRLLTVGIPYLAWTVFYTGLQWWQGARTADFTQWLHQLGFYTVHGDAWFHLYFLLVSMQVYLLYPLIAALLRATTGHHGVLLAISAAVQLGLLSVLTYWPPHTGFGGWYVDQAPILFFTYQFYVLLGAVTALHLDQAVAWVRGHTAIVLAGLVGAGTLAEVWYLIATRHQQAALAAGVLQPVELPWAVAMVVALFALGIRWSTHRTPGSRLDRGLDAASDRSFGIYLCHPAVLFAIVWAGGHWLPQHLSGAALTLVVYPLTVLGAVALTELLRRTPVSLALTGRGRLTRKEPAHATHLARPADARSETPHPRPDDDDRRWAADPVLPGRAVELQRAD